MSAFHDFWLVTGMVVGVFVSMYLARERFGDRAMLMMAVFLFSMISMIVIAPVVFGGE